MTSPITAWNDLLSPSLAADSAGWLTEQLTARGLVFGDRPLCTVLRPRFLLPAELDRLRARIAPLLRAFGRALEAALARTDVMDQFRPADWERTLVAEDPGIPASPLSRLDAFYSPADGRFRFTEYNAETPAGAAYNDALTELFLALPVMRAFRARWAVRPLPARHQVLHSLLGAWEAFSGGTTRPSIAIIDWRDVPTQSEFRLYQEYFRALGFGCVIADPRDCEYRDNRLWAGGRAIDLVYKRVLIAELIEHGGLTHPLVRAVRDRAVCMANPFRCKVLHKKASMAVLSDERNAALFTAAQRRAIADLVPWTRVVEERTTLFEGREVDLLPFAVANRERLALKPNDDYGGAGIVLGWTVDAGDWAAALAHALDHPFVLQERIELPSETFPGLGTDGVEFGERVVDTAPFVFDGAFADGCLTRVSTDALVNVTAGGGSTVPTLVVAPR
jgi:uncharacterized circularly permuted ATP-grasp superfamily protein